MVRATHRVPPPSTRRTSTASSISELAPYVPLETLHAELGSIAVPEEYGRSVEGRPLLAYRLPGTGPTLLVTAGLHGLEYIGTEVARQVLRDGPVPNATLLVCPVLNPDGYARTWQQAGRGDLASMRKNAAGVDLNRNFPRPYGAGPPKRPFAGNDSPSSVTYRGPHALSEPETRHLAAFLQALHVHGSVNLHSFMGTQITPRVLHRSDWSAYTALSKAFRRGQGHWLGYPRVAAPFGDVFTGELEDWQHHVLGCWATCIECFSLAESARQHLRSPSVFWRFNPRQPQQVVERDAAGVRAWLVAARDLQAPLRRPGSNRVFAAPVE